MNPFATLWKHGLRGTVNLYWSELNYRCALLRTRNVEAFRNPLPEELLLIEAELAEINEKAEVLQADPPSYYAFTNSFKFPSDYHGGTQTGHWQEKIFEHFISYSMLDIESFGRNDIYLDVAAGSSPWVRMLRESLCINAFALDLLIRSPLRKLSFYLEEDATRTSFASGTVRGISLHCAFEMFTGSNDILAITEFARILAPGGSVVIVPLYLHTHFCCYSTPEYWGRGYADPGSREYVRRECRGIPSSRKYDPTHLRERVLEPARRVGLEPHLYSLRGQSKISPEIYCHFILELRKPNDSRQ